jgi:hypothetical protein
MGNGGINNYITHISKENRKDPNKRFFWEKRKTERKRNNMQTFLPYPDIIKSIECLDNKRLGKQRVEAYQIYKIVSGQDPESRWRNHPAVKMWMGFPSGIAMYMNWAIFTWIDRGFKNTMDYIYDGLIHSDISDTLIPEDYLFLGCNQINFRLPYWFGNKEFHDSHKSNLLRKMPEHYSKFNWNVPDNLPYVWPV